ncbi:P27 family phage terminase small subunit, partial [Escherichia coli]|uniref:P27 family phage terminase small subunit n=1 Tax=Escherichia coli TaxID=562 RepID=UPI00301E36E6
TETQSGDVLIKAHPAAAWKGDAWKRIGAMLAEFGMSPASRAKVNLAGPDDVDPLAELLKARD